MTQAPFFAPPPAPTSSPTAAPSPPHFGYARASAQAALTAADTLAVLGFGASAPCLDDPRYLRVGLAPLDGDGVIEVWRARGPVQHGRDGDVRWASDGDWLFGAIELAEAAHGGIANATAEAYRQLLDFSQRSAQPQVQRVWNYLADINLGDGDDERYRHFCSGRAAGMNGGFATQFPAASAIGRSDGVRTLQVYWLAARAPGQSVENPRQVSAWRYPRQYGPTAPSFARALRAPCVPVQLHVSGTAAVVGHASQHDEDLAAQLDETFANLASLFASADAAGGFDARGLVKAYVRRREDAAMVGAALDARLPPGTPRMLLLGDICRRELLVEIDGVQPI